MTRMFGLLLLLVSAGNAFAQSHVLYKCSPKNGGPVSFQSHPCEETADTVSTTPYTPERDLTPQDRSAREAALKRNSAEMSRGAGTDGRRRPQPQGASIPIHGGSKCEAAKRRRDDYLERVGLNRTFDGLRAWDEQVRAACK